MTDAHVITRPLQAVCHGSREWRDGARDGIGRRAHARDRRAREGNISKPSGERIYHVPGSSSYEETRIDEADGERWFCTEEDARRAGWRPRH
jgi:hypothetical protein